jgi:TonB family protein
MADLKNDIDKYLRGELSPSEMHALEKKALRDPFLEEALEGAGQIPTEELEADLRMLQNTLNQRLNASKVKSIPIWVWPLRIAAGFLVIALSTYIIIQYTRNHPSQDLAENKDSSTVEKNEAQRPIVGDSLVQEKDNYLTLAKPEVAKSKSSPIQEYDAQDSKKEAENSVSADVLAEQKPIEPAPSAAPKTDEVQSSSEITAEEKTVRTVPEELQTQPVQIPESRKFSVRERDKNKKDVSDVAASRAAEDVPANTKIIRGQVTSEDGSGLPGVNVMIKGSNVGVVTDGMGNYQIPVREEDTSLVFSFIGYTSAEVGAAGKNEVDLQLREDVSQLSEVVVVGYGGDRDLDDNLTSPLELAVPTGGRRAFKLYLEENLRYPEQALANKVEGKVTVMFTVETSGALSDFRVLKGIGNGCDDEVIRLIKEGPKWTPSKRKDESIRDKVKVRMRFALPKNKK